MPLPYAAIALLCLVPTACTPASSADVGWEGSVDTLPGGVVRVVNQGGAGWVDGSWRLTEELRIGRIDGDGPDLFGELVGVEVDPLGRIWVADAQAAQVRVFDAEGRHVRSIGGAGAGPGEFRGLAGMAWAPDGTLWTMDNGNARLAVFDTAGAYLEGHARRGGMMVSPWRGGFDHEGRFYDPGTVEAEGELVPALNRFGPGMGAAGSLRLPRVDGDEFVHDGDGGQLRAGVPFTRYLIWRMDGRGGIWAAASDEYRLARIDFRGDTVQVVERRAERVPVTAADRAEAVEGLSWFTDAGGRVDPSRIPRFKPALRSVTVDDAGYLWVRPEQPRGAAPVLDVFEPAGRFLGSVELPADPGPFPLFTVRGNAIYAVIRGEADEPVVVRWRIDGRS